MMAPALGRAGFRFRPVLHFWTAPIRRMLKLTLPAAIGAGAVQVNLVISTALAIRL